MYFNNSPRKLFNLRQFILITTTHFAVRISKQKQKKIIIKRFFLKHWTWGTFIWNQKLRWKPVLMSFCWNRTGAYIAIRKIISFTKIWDIWEFIWSIFLHSHVFTRPFRVLLNLTIVNWVLLFCFPNFCYDILVSRNNLLTFRTYTRQVWVWRELFFL